MSSSWKAVLGIVLVFAFGVVSGVLSTAGYFHRKAALFFQGNPGVIADAAQGYFTHDIDLDANQKARIHQLLLDDIAERRKLQSRIQPDLQALNVQLVQQIREVMRPDQVGRFKENVTELRRRLARLAFHGAAADGKTPLSKTGSNATTNSTSAAPAPAPSGASVPNHP
jgi:hypothetical protein